MATITLPFKTSSEIDSNDVDIANDELYKSLPMSLQDVIKNNNHLLKYLHNIPIEEIGIPVYCPVLSRKMGDEKTPNFIYPTNSKEVFIHILFSKVDHRNSYIPIEPALTMNMDHFVRTLEVKLLGLGNKLATMSTNPDKKQQLLEYLEYVTVLKGNGGSTHLSTPNENTKIDKSLKLKLNKYELECLRYVFIRDKIGLGALEPLINDPYIEDISCSGLGQIFVEHKIFKSLKSAVTFNSIEELDDFVLWLGERIRKPVTFRNPIVDATLPDGSRINIVYGKDVSKRGSNFTIRKFSGVPTSIFELVEFGSINYQMLAYLSLVIGNGMNVFVSGETASGKTTLINALTTFIHPMAKIVSIEDTPELQVPHKNWIREVVQSTKIDDSGGAVNMFDLLKAALRQRPNEIIIGEIRGPEGNIAFQAMQTGHSVMATFHAASVEKLIQRLTGNPILVPKAYVGNLNVVILTSMVKLPNGKMGRRITGVNEIVDYDSYTDSFTIVNSFIWDESNDNFEFTGNLTSHVLENLIAPKLGIAGNKRRQVYSELERRAKILEKIHKELKITDFYEVLEVISKAQRDGLF